MGEILTADTSDISDPDGVEKAFFAYQWIAGGGDIKGATGSRYTIAAGAEGRIIQVWVFFTDDSGHTETLTSEGTQGVSPEIPPTTPATGVPTITGTARAGETLTVDTSGSSILSLPHSQVRSRISSARSNSRFRLVSGPQCWSTNSRYRLVNLT